MCSEIIFSLCTKYYSLYEIVPLEQMGEVGRPQSQILNTPLLRMYKITFYYSNLNLVGPY